MRGFAKVIVKLQRSESVTLLARACLCGARRFDDEEFWPDVKAMTDELHRMGIRLMVSVWPQIDLKSENYDEMKRRNFLAKTRTGKDVGMWWPRDVHSTFDDLKSQITCAIHMGAAGIPWFTTDMGGFAGSDITTDDFKELFVRWCQFSTFLPVMHNHGDRGPNNHQIKDRRGNEYTHVHTGDDNEPWSFGPEVEKTFVKYINLREAMRPYTRELFHEAHENGQPLVRGLFYEFPGEEAAADIADEYTFGPDLLVAPVTVDAPLDVVPVFARDGRDHGLAGRILSERSPRDFDAVFALTDSIAIGVLKALTEAGVRVPEDVMVVGFDGVTDGAYTNPGLTSVAIDTKEIATVCLDLLIDRIEAVHGGSGVSARVIPAPRTRVLSCRLTARGSAERR